MTVLGRFLAIFLTGYLVVLAGSAQAQVTDEDRAFYEQWLSAAERGERVVDADKASNAALEKLRSDIAGYRRVFLETRTQNGERIQTLQSQITALGPEPESGHEPTDIAKLRVALNDQLDALRVPRIVAEEAYNRANGLISEIDQSIRKREASRLLARGPSPLNLTYWPAALSDIQAALEGLWNETRRNLTSATVREQVQNRLPAIIVLSGLGLLLLIRGGPWSERLGEYLRRFGGRGTGIWRFFVSLFKIVLPLAGTVFVVSALQLTGIPGFRGLLLLESVSYWAAILLMFNWLGDQLYSGRREVDLVPVPPKRRTEMRVYVVMLAMTLVLYDAIGLYDKIERISEASRAVVSYPVIVTAALILLRLQRVGLKIREVHGAPGRDGDNPAGYPRIVRVIRRVALLLGFLAPVLGGAGYIHAAEALIFPAILTLAVISAILILQRFLVDLYSYFRASKEGRARDSMFSVVMGFVLWLLALPVLALIWGARVAQLTELWSKFLEGFQIGGVTISPVGFMTFAMVFGAIYAATKMVQGSLRNNLLPKTKIDPGGQNAIVAFTGYAGITLAALVAVTSAGLDLSSVAIVAGALSVGIGFGLQTIVSNFVSGIILLIERPISKGDWIEVAGNAGYVRDISVRSTRIETFDRSDIIVPNSDLISGTVTNYTRGNTVGRVITPVGVAYGSDTREVEKILREVANEHPMVLSNPPPAVLFRGFGADSLDFEIRAILRDVNWMMSVRSDMNYEIDRRFAEAGIEIPFAQRDVWLRNPQALRETSQDGAPDPGDAPRPGPDDTTTEDGT